MDQPPVPTREGGRFVKGQSGNPAGRPPKSRSLQQELKEAFLAHVSVDKLKRVINKVVERAEGGDMRAAKILLDKLVPNASPDDEGEDTGRKVVFVIENATFAAQAQKAIEQQQPIDVEVTDVTPIKQVVNEQ